MGNVSRKQSPAKIGIHQTAATCIPIEPSFYFFVLVTRWGFFIYGTGIPPQLET